MNTSDSRKTFHLVYDTAIIAVKALLRVICEPHLLDAEPILRGRIFVQQDDPALVGGSASGPDTLLN
jgi:hypothetical protein